MRKFLAVFEYEKEAHNFSLEFTLHKMFVRRTLDKKDLLAISENEVELLTNVLPWTPVELAKKVFNITTRNPKIFLKRFSR